jgi:hypothetical protein
VIFPCKKIDQRGWNQNDDSSYHSLQVSAQKTVSKNFSLNGVYVLSHALWTGGVGALTVAQDNDMLWGERGPTDYDQRHFAVIGGVWNLSYYNGGSALSRQILNGWTIAPIVTLKSGLPVNILTGSDKNCDGYTTDRPNGVAGADPFLDPHRSRQTAAAEWFNTAAFIPNGPGQPGGIGPDGADGDVGRDFLRAFGYKDIDLGLYRTISVDRYALQLRGEATNVFNMVSLAAPTANLASDNNGKILGAQGSQRVIQLGVKFTF